MALWPNETAAEQSGSGLNGPLHVLWVSKHLSLTTESTTAWPVIFPNITVGVINSQQKEVVGGEDDFDFCPLSIWKFPLPGVTDPSPAPWARCAVRAQVWGDAHHERCLLQGRMDAMLGHRMCVSHAPCFFAVLYVGAWLFTKRVQNVSSLDAAVIQQPKPWLPDFSSQRLGL